MQINEVTGQIIGAAIEVHRHLGPGLLEGVYQQCLAWELENNGMRVVQQHPLPVMYKGKMLEPRLRLDMVVDAQVIVELKSIDRLTPLHDAQLLTYLKLTDMRVGLLINFNVEVLRNGIRRLINGQP